MNCEPVKVEIINSDVRKGKTVEHIHEFHTIQDAQQFVKDFNAVLKDTDWVLDVYQFARLVDRRVNL